MGEGQSCDTDQDLDLGAWTGPPGRTYKYILSKYAKAKYEKYRFGHRQGFRSGGTSTVRTIQAVKTSADCMAGIHQVLLKTPSIPRPPPSQTLCHPQANFLWKLGQSRPTAGKA